MWKIKYWSILSVVKYWKSWHFHSFTQCFVQFHPYRATREGEERVGQRKSAKNPEKKTKNDVRKKEEKKRGKLEKRNKILRKLPKKQKLYARKRAIDAKKRERKRKRERERESKREKQRGLGATCLNWVLPYRFLRSRSLVALSIV